MRGPRVGLVVAGALIALIGFGLTLGGSVLLWAHGTQRDSAGFYTTPTAHLKTSTYAMTSDVDLGAQPGQHDWDLVHHLGTVRLRVTPATDAPMFVGIAPTADVNRWLAGVPHTHVTDIEFWPTRVHETDIAGTSEPVLPDERSFWVASSSGSGVRTVTWPIESGKWSAVVMNADAAPGIRADVVVGAKSGILLPIGIAFLLGGVAALAIGVLLTLAGVRTATATTEAAETPVSAAARPEGAYPARLDARLDDDLGRWLWLVKWILVIPHAIVLAFLWVAVMVLTFVAGVSILFTGRYPRSIFDFNVGVMRWTWRVGYWSFAANGTDRYPPFSLDADPTYPADLSVDYPERLSRGLVLVKWWLLALPHYLIVAIFAGGWNTGREDRGGGAGLVSLIVLISVVVLLVRNRYPRGLFDFVMGLNRWCFRVFAYAALLRDEYPPFRLDMGGTDPGSVVPVEPIAPPPEPAPTSREDLTRV